jgi:hypothetical protein
MEGRISPIHKKRIKLYGKTVFRDSTSFSSSFPPLSLFSFSIAVLSSLLHQNFLLFL